MSVNMIKREHTALCVLWEDIGKLLVCLDDITQLYVATGMNPSINLADNTKLSITESEWCLIN